jgi:hypothetical protein
VCSFALYKQRALEQLKVSKDMPALQLIKQEVGMYFLVKRKQEELSNVLPATRRTQQPRRTEASHPSVVPTIP